MSIATLFGKLQEHEMELLRLNQHEEKKKGCGAMKKIREKRWRKGKERRRKK